MKVLITGVGGFIGSWLLKRLHKESVEVSVLIRNPQQKSFFENKGCRVFVGDVTEVPSLRSALAGQNQVYHLAGLIAYDRKMAPLMHQINVVGTQNVVEAAIGAGVQRVLLVSSGAAVGGTFRPAVLNEESPYELEEYHLGYHESKREAERTLLGFVQEGQIEGVIVNPSTVYGAGDAEKATRSTQLRVARGEVRYYPPGGVSIAAIEDVIAGIVAAMRQGRNGQRYILSGENLTLKQVFEMISREAGVSPPRWALPPWVLQLLARGDGFLTQVGLRGPIPAERAMVARMYHWYDCTKAQQELGYAPRSAREAIAASVGWMREQGLLDRS